MARFTYVSDDAMTERDLQKIRDKYLSDKSRDLSVYLATPPSIFSPVCQSLRAVGLARVNARMVMERA